ncbi:hypothetical protein O3M35_013248 [Rhynocoris fuscipes]|uniref:Uncharacterized protein n=1 Tax=Rhynocoris fuscipes TaxID=488301 RepID=A0AAW1CI97_9HEMI
MDFYRNNYYKVKDQIDAIIKACNHTAADVTDTTITAINETTGYGKTEDFLTSRTTAIHVKNSHVGTSANAVRGSDVISVANTGNYLLVDDHQHSLALSHDSTDCLSPSIYDNSITQFAQIHRGSASDVIPSSPPLLHSSDTQESNPLSSCYSADESAINAYLKFNFRIKFDLILLQVQNFLQFQSDYIHHLLKSINTIYTCCEFNIRYKRINQSYCKIHLHCIYRKCRRATCTIKYNISPDGFVDASLELFGKLNHSGEHQFRQIRGLTRQKVKETLKDKSVHRYYQDTVLKENETTLAHRIVPNLATVWYLKENTFRGSSSGRFEKNLKFYASMSSNIPVLPTEHSEHMTGGTTGVSI